MAPPLGMEVHARSIVRDAAEIEHAITNFARSPNGGVIVTGETGDEIIASSFSSFW
jgi:hypothetical protein